MAGSGAIGKPGDITSPNHGSSRTTIWGESGSAVGTASARATRWARTARTATAKAVPTATPARVSDTPSVTGPTNCHFTGPRYPRAAATVEERRHAEEAVVVEVRDDRSARVEAAHVDGDAAVLTERHPVDAEQGLGDHPLGRRAPGQRRERGQVVLAQCERGGIVGVAVGQAADARSPRRGAARRPGGARRARPRCRGAPALWCLGRSATVVLLLSVHPVRSSARAARREQPGDTRHVRRLAARGTRRQGCRSWPTSRRPRPRAVAGPTPPLVAAVTAWGRASPGWSSPCSADAPSATRSPITTPAPPVR